METKELIEKMYEAWCDNEDIGKEVDKSIFMVDEMLSELCGKYNVSNHEKVTTISNSIDAIAEVERFAFIGGFSCAVALLNMNNNIDIYKNIEKVGKAE